MCGGIVHERGASGKRKDFGRPGGFKEALIWDLVGNQVLTTYFSTLYCLDHMKAGRGKCEGRSAFLLAVVEG
jgi:hypothetical protein